MQINYYSIWIMVSSNKIQKFSVDTQISQLSEMLLPQKPDSLLIPGYIFLLGQCKKSLSII